jgi:hypothetical protein
MISLNLLIQFGIGKKTSKEETVDEHPYLTRRVMARVQSLLRQSHYQLPTKFYPTSSPV